MFKRGGNPSLINLNLKIVYQPLILYPSPHNREMYSLHEREVNFLKGLSPLLISLVNNPNLKAIIDNSRVI